MVERVTEIILWNKLSKILFCIINQVFGCPKHGFEFM